MRENLRNLTTPFSCGACALECSESGSSDVNAKVSPPSQPASTTTASRDEERVICMTPEQMAPLILVGSLGVVATVLMLLCQIGALGRDQQVDGNKTSRSSFATSGFVLADDHRRADRRRNSNQCSPSALIADCRQPYQCYTAEA